MTKKLLIISDAPDAKTGFARNCQCIIDGLKNNENIEIAVASLTDVKSREADGYTVFPGRVADGKQDYGRRQIPKIINKWEPDIVLSIVDLQMVSYLKNLKYPSEVQVNIDQPYKSYDPNAVANQVRDKVKSMKDRDTFKWVALVPIDGEPVPRSWHNILKHYVDEVVAMSKYGKEQLKKDVGVHAKYIPHGAKIDEFMNKDSASKEDVFGIPEDHFLVGTVNRNQKRKMYPRLIKAFAKFYHEDSLDDAHLYLHCDYQDRAGWDITELLVNEGLAVPNGNGGFRSIKNSDGTPVVLPYAGKVSFDKLMDIYSSFDVFFSATGGEGFGLTTIEAMASETPVLITDYTTSREIVDGNELCLIPVETMYRPVPEFSGCERALIDVDSAANRIFQFYSPDVPTPVGLDMLNPVDEYDWESVGQRWDDYISDLEV